jgi:hypothetical protein
MNDVRIGIGIGGVISIGRTTILQQPPIDISLYGASWTVKTVSVSNRTDNGGITYLVERGFAHGAASLTSSTAATLGVLQLVTPTQHVVVGVPGNNDRSGSITRMTFHFLSPIPEPGPFLLLSTGAVGLALLGRARRRR